MNEDLGPNLLAILPMRCLKDSFLVGYSDLREFLGCKTHSREIFVRGMVEV